VSHDSTANTHLDAHDMADGIRWSQVTSRSQAAEGQFLYGVKSTKIFCRPTCKARLPRRANVDFYDTPEQAQAAGYRACKRCQPLLPVYRPEADKIQKSCDFMESLPEDAPLPGLERLAKEAGLTKHHFHRLFKRETGLTPREYAIARRRQTRSDTAESSVSSVSSVAIPVTPYVNNPQTPVIVDEELFCGASIVGWELLDDIEFPPCQELREMVIYYNIVATTYGLLLVAFRDGQVCKLELGTTRQELTDGLEEDYPMNCYIHSDVEMASAEDADAFRDQTKMLIDGLENPCGKLLDVPLLLPSLGSNGMS